MLGYETRGDYPLLFFPPQLLLHGKIPFIFKIQKGRSRNEAISCCLL